MAKGYNEEITSIDTLWSGYSGSKVENFIKGEIKKLNNSKVGYISEDTNGIVTFYKDEETFTNSPGDYFYQLQKEPLYRLETKVDNIQYFLISDDKFIKWKFRTVYNNSNSTILYTENVEVEYTLTKDNQEIISFTQIENYNSDESNDPYTNIQLNLSNYITTYGVYKLSMSVKGKTTNLKVENIEITLNVISFSFKDITDFYTIKTDRFKIQAEVTCKNSKGHYVEYRINDGDFKESDFKDTTDAQAVTDNTDVNLKDFNLEDGVHTIDYRFKVVLGTSYYYTDIIRMEFVIKNNDNSYIEPKILTYTKYNEKNPIKYEDKSIIYGLTQYTESKVIFGFYHESKNSTSLSYSILNDAHGSINVENGKKYEIPVSTPLTGLTNMNFNINDIKSLNRDILLYIDNLDLGIKICNTDLVFNVSSVGKSKNSIDGKSWVSNVNGKEYSAEFNSDFDWSKGWTKNGLVISKNSEITFNYIPLPAENVEGHHVGGRNNGYTFEIEFMTQNVTKDNVVLCNMINNDGNGVCGIQITGTEFKFIAPDGNSVSTRFKTGDLNRIALVINPRKGTKNGEEVFKGLIELYVNGVLSGIAKYSEKDKFFININKKPGYLKFNGSENGDIVIKHIRAYENALTDDNILDNYILYRSSFNEIEDLIKRNDIMDDDDKTKISYTKISKNVLKVPIMFLIGRTNNNVPTPDSNKDIDGQYVAGIIKTDDKSFYKTLENTTNKKEPVNMDIVYYNPSAINKNFKFINAYVTPQGTSSMYYPKKNYRIYTQKNKDTRMLMPNGEHLMDNLSVLITSAFGETTESLLYEDKNLRGEKNKSKRKYKFRDNSQAVKCWCLKADFAESSSSHNTGIARLWNNVLKTTDIKVPNKDKVKDLGTLLKTKAQSVIEKKYPKDAPDVRTTIDGFPIVVFGSKSYDFNDPENPLTFLGQYNFNNDKSTESVFGFCDIDSDTIELQYTCFDYKSSAFTRSESENKITCHIDDQLDKYMICVETLDNGNELANFKTMEYRTIDDDGSEKTMPWLDAWDTAFEFRYPEIPEEPDKKDFDDEEEYEDALKEWNEELEKWKNLKLKPFKHFAEWVNSVKWCNVKGQRLPEIDIDEAQRRKDRFEKEKWEHLDVWKVAAYYVYLMRFGAVDQVVKNSMLTSEGPFAYDINGYEIGYWDDTDISEDEYGKYHKWYYINYDNDTIMGVKNDGRLVYSPDITRTSMEGEVGNQTPIYAGYESVLWNTLEHDAEFQDIIKWVDQSISKTLSYRNAINEFEKEQVNRWSERIYNKDALYKYIDSYVGGWEYDYENAKEEDRIEAEKNKISDKLFMVQGSRTAHRRWWLSKRFNLFDGKWNSGDYSSKYVEIKCNYNQKGAEFTAIAGANAFFGYQINGRTFGTEPINGANYEYGETDKIKWNLGKDIQIGDPIAIYGANDLLELNLTNLSKNLSEINFYFDTTGDDPNKLERLILSIPEDLLTNHYYYMEFSDDDDSKANRLTAYEKLTRYCQNINHESKIWEQEEKDWDVNLTFDTPLSSASENTVNLYRVYYEENKNHVYFLKVQGSIRNTALTGLTTSNFDKLKVLGVVGYVGLTNLDLSTNKNIEEVDAGYTSLSKIVFTEDGSNLEFLNISDSFTELTLQNCERITFDGLCVNGEYLNIHGGKNLNTIKIENCKHLSDYKLLKFVENWCQQKIDENINRYLTLRGITWENVSLDQIKILDDFANKHDVNLNGTIEIAENSNITNEVKDLISSFKTHVKGDYTIKVPNGIIINGPSEIIGKESTITYSCDILPSIDIMDETTINGNSIYEINYVFVKELSKEEADISSDKLIDNFKGKYYEVIDNGSIRNETLSFIKTPNKDNNYSTELSIKENEIGEDTETLIGVILKSNSLNTRKFDVMPLLIKDPTYAIDGDIEGYATINMTNHSYDFTLNLLTNKNEYPTGTVNIEWSIENIDNGLEYISGYTFNDNVLTIVTNDKSPGVQEGESKIAKFRIKVTATNVHENEKYPPITFTKDIAILNKDVILTKDTNGIVLNIFNSIGKAANSEYMTLSEALTVTALTHNDQNIFANIEESYSFNELEYFSKLEEIPSGCFKGSNITEITIPSNIRSIGKNAFENCKNLKNVNFTSGSLLNTINESAFKSCSSLHYIILPYNLRSIENYAFANTNLNGILFNEYKSSKKEGYIYIDSGCSLQYIKNYAFDDNAWGENITLSTNRLKEISLPKNIVISEGNSCYKFLLSDKLEKINVINEEYENITIKDNIIYSSNDLVRVLPFVTNEVDELNLTDIIKVYDYAFYNNKNIKKVILTPSLNGQNALGTGIFYNSEIESIDLSESFISYLPNYTFYNTKKLKEIEWNTSITILGHNLFVNCENLTGITIPNSVNTIKTINSGTTNTNTFVNCGFEKLEFPENFASGQSFTNFIVGCQNLKEVILPAYAKITNNVNVIVNCENLESVTLPIFSYTNSEEENVVINDNVKWEVGISNNLFINNCKNLTEFISNNKNNNRKFIIYKGAIYKKGNENSNELSIVVVPYNSESDVSTYINNVVVNNEEYKVVEIGNCSFNNTRIETLKDIESVKKIGERAFNNCFFLTEVVIPDSISTIPLYTFDGCVNLSILTIGTNVSSIGANAFKDCKNLYEIKILGTDLVDGLTCNYQYLNNNILLYDSHPFNNVGTNIEGEKNIYVPYNSIDSFKFKVWSIGIYDSKDKFNEEDVYENLNDIYVTDGFFNKGNFFLRKTECENYYEGQKKEFQQDKFYQIIETDGYWLTPLLNEKAYNFKISELSLNKEVTLKLINENGESYDNGTITLVSDNDKLRFTATNEPRTSTFNNDINGYNIDLNNNVSQGEEISIFDDDGNYIGSFIAEYEVNTYEVQIENIEHNASTYSLRNNSNTEEMANITKKEYEALLSRVNQMAEIIGKLKK